MFARNYTIGYFGPGVGGSVARNPVVDRLLPSLLHVKAVSLLDHALEAWLDARGLVVPRKRYGTDLKGRIDYLADNRHLSDATRLHLIRDTRNALAHEPDAGVAIDWPQLDETIDAVFAALQELTLPVERPQWEISAERSAAQEAKVPNALFTFDHTISIKAGDKVVAAITWSSHLMNDDA
jgi:hypothetical protein